MCLSVPICSHFASHLSSCHSSWNINSSQWKLNYSVICCYSGKRLLVNLFIIETGVPALPTQLYHSSQKDWNLAKPESWRILGFMEPLLLLSSAAHQGNTLNGLLPGHKTTSIVWLLDTFSELLPGCEVRSMPEVWLSASLLFSSAFK